MSPLLKRRLELAALWVVPILMLIRGGSGSLGRATLDKSGHLWMGWHAARESPFSTQLLAFPEGLDLMPVLGGWLDVILVGGLSRVLPLEASYNLVLALYFLVAGLAGWALSRALDAPRGALVAGLLLQLDGFVWMHMDGGRPEQVGLGFAALAAVALLELRRLPQGAPWWKAALLGVMGGSVLWVSWELALLTVLCTGVMLPFVLKRGHLRAAGIAAAAALAVHGPWVLFFLLRISAVRDIDEGHFSQEVAQRASVGLLSWLGPGPRPTWAALLCLLAVPFASRDRRLWLPLLAGLLLLLVFALGPDPGLWSVNGPPGQPKAETFGVQGPFLWLQSLPVLGWFHWPDRLLAAWSVAAVGAAGVVVHRLPGRWAWGLGLGLVLFAAGEQTRHLPVTVKSVVTERYIVAAGQLALGAVLDLPMQPSPEHHLQYQMMQVTHGRPILFNIVLDHLSGGSIREMVQGDPVLSWFNSLMDRKPPTQPDWGRADLEALQAQGFGVIALHQRGWPKPKWRAGREALEGVLGPAQVRGERSYMAWKLPESLE
ncbi:MAG: hypothetical protein ACI9VR_001697 [Cognaticolwellia sp.]|jgi:hypothetical protein